jgi:dynein heavy chain
MFEFFSLIRFSNISNLLESNSFEKSFKFAGNLEETQQNFERNENLDLESHLAGKTDVVVYKQLLADFKTQLAKAKDITDTVTAGVFKLDFGRLKGRVLPAISRCIEQLYQVLPRIARNRMDAILKEKNIAEISTY